MLQLCIINYCVCVCVQMLLRTQKSKSNIRGNDHKLNLASFYYRASICEGGLGSRNSVCPSHAWIVTKLNDALQIFRYHTKGQ